MLFSYLPFLLTALALSAWFWRREKRDASLWMVLTYAGAGLMLWEPYSRMGTLADGLPIVVRDFLLIGIVGLVQSLAVAKRIPIWMAVAIIFGLFVLAYSLPFGPQMKLNTSADSDNPLAESWAAADPEGEYLIAAKTGISQADLQAWAAQEGFSLRRAFRMADEAATDLDDFFVLDVSQANQATESLIINSGLVDYLEVNEQVQVSPLNADPIRNKRKEIYGINDPAASEQWVMEALGMPAYYQQLRSLKPQKVARIAILDTGIDAEHEDLKANYHSTKKTYDNDPQGHGTHCAGIAAAATDNGIGIGSLAGPGKFVEVTSIKVLSSGGMGTQKTIIQGILEAADSGVDVISMSLGGASNASRQRAYNQAVSYANRQGAIVVVAAGNSNREATNFAPANAAGVICVSAIDNLQLRAPFSNRVGGIRMAIAAPGVAIYSTLPNSKYAAYSGTSMACPFVAGLVGVMKSLRPELTTAQVYELLNSTAKRSSEVEQLGGIVQPAAVLKAMEN